MPLNVLVARLFRFGEAEWVGRVESCGLVNNFATAPYAKTELAGKNLNRAVTFGLA